MIAVMTAPAAPGATPAGPDQGKLSFYVAEPYSRRTNERLRLTTWEKLDFGITSFIYGLSNGLSFAAASETNNLTGPMVVGALAYTGLGVLYLNTARIDRGDLPLVLAITSYIPATTGLVALTVPSLSSKAGASMVAGSGLLALPLAYFAGAATDLDPGDAQLVRDAGFWGLLWGVTAGLVSMPSDPDPSFRTAGITGLVGLYGGLGLGLLAASYSDVSLERVRVSTWGGYGGAVIGVLIAAASQQDARGAYTSFAVGSALGVFLTFLSTSSIDAVPADAGFDGKKPVSSLRYLEPSVLPVVDHDGRIKPRLGLNLVRGRF
jgi:hypothetical protein